MPQRKTTRRQFLKGESAVEALANVGEDLLPEGPIEPAPLAAAAGAYLFQMGRRAMACQFQIMLNAGQYPRGPALAVRALELVDQLEAQMTIYREDSEIQFVNAHAAQQPVEVEALLFQLLEEALSISAITNGAFDITAGPLSDLWGFSRRQGRLPSEADIEATLQKVGAQGIRLAPQQRTVSLASPDLRINLNSIGKGYALDRCAELFDEGEVNDYLIHGGHSSVLARGSRRRTDERGWSVALRHPLRPEIRLGEILLCDRALGTSGSANQFFHHRGRRLSHVLDLRTGRPAEGVLSVSVLAPTCRLADALATACFVLGVDDSDVLFDEVEDLAAIFVLPGDRVGAIDIVTINVDEDIWIST